MIYKGVTAILITNMNNIIPRLVNRRNKFTPDDVKRDNEPLGNKDGLIHEIDTTKVDADQIISRRYGKYFNDIFYPLEELLDYFIENSLQKPIEAMTSDELTAFFRRKNRKVILELVKIEDGRNYIQRILNHILSSFDRRHERSWNKIRFNTEKSVLQWLYRYEKFNYVVDPSIIQITQQLEFIHKKLCTLEQKYFTEKISS